MEMEDGEPTVMNTGVLYDAMEALEPVIQLGLESFNKGCANHPEANIREHHANVAHGLETGELHLRVVVDIKQESDIVLVGFAAAPDKDLKPIGLFKMILPRKRPAASQRVN